MILTYIIPSGLRHEYVMSARPKASITLTTDNSTISCIFAKYKISGYEDKISGLNHTQKTLRNSQLKWVVFFSLRLLTSQEEKPSIVMCAQNRWHWPIDVSVPRDNKIFALLSHERNVYGGLSWVLPEYDSVNELKLPEWSREPEMR